PLVDVPIVALATAAGLAAGHALPDGNLLLTAVLGSIGLCVGAVGVFLLFPARARAAANGLASIPFPFPHDQYLELLALPNNRFEFVLTFRAYPNRNVVEQRFESVRGALHFKSQTIANLAPPKFDLEESTSGVGTGGWRDTGRPIHGWFSREALPALLDMHREAGLVSVAIDA